MVGWALVALVAVVLGLRILHGGGQPPPPLALGGGGASSPAGVRGSPAAGGAPQVMVQVAGEVERPGVYRVPSGARVNDAVARAGGLTRRADPAGVNLVARVQDGQQVVVPRRGAGGVVAVGGSTAVTSSGSSAASTAGPISLGSATAAQLDTLDGIGPTLAQRIVDYRQAHGGFGSVDQLRQVEGIGEKRFAALEKAVTP